MVRILPSSSRSAGSIPGWGAKISYVSWKISQRLKKKKKKQCCNKFNKDFKKWSTSKKSFKKTCSVILFWMKEPIIDTILQVRKWTQKFSNLARTQTKWWSQELKLKLLHCYVVSITLCDLFKSRTCMSAGQCDTVLASQPDWDFNPGSATI